MKCKNAIYGSKTENTIKNITQDQQYFINTIYKNDLYNFYWFENSKGYIHVLKPHAMKCEGIIEWYSIEDMRLKPNDMLHSEFYGRYKTELDCIQAIENYCN